MLLGGEGEQATGRQGRKEGRNRRGCIETASKLGVRAVMFTGAALSQTPL